MATCLIALGSNVGDRRRTLDLALELLDRHPSVRVAARSRWRETEPVGGPAGQAPFLNGAALLETSLEPALLAALLWETEAQLGRTRHERWGPRTLDLDLLLYDDRTIETPRLSVPHPRMAWRRFVLEPAAEIVPALLHPTIGWTIARLLEHLDTAAPYLAIAGPIAADRGRLARSVVDERNRRRPGSTRLIADPVPPHVGQPPDADCPSNAVRTEIEFLETRAKLLAADSPQWRSPGEVALSDFWFEQPLAYASLPKPEDSAAVRRRCEDLVHRVVPPKLLAVLGPLDDQIGHSIASLARRPGRGPLLFLDNADLGRAAEELLAAIDAME